MDKRFQVNRKISRIFLISILIKKRGIFTFNAMKLNDLGLMEIVYLIVKEVYSKLFLLLLTIVASELLLIGGNKNVRVMWYIHYAHKFMLHLFYYIYIIMNDYLKRMHGNEYKWKCYRNVITGELLLHIILLINFIGDWYFCPLLGEETEILSTGFLFARILFCHGFD